jgi:hypothetical protein
MIIRSIGFCRVVDRRSWGGKKGEEKGAEKGEEKLMNWYGEMSSGDLNPNSGMKIYPTSF